MTDSVTLERWRLACGILFVFVGIVGGGNYAGWWRIDGSSLTTDPLWRQYIQTFIAAWFIGLILLGGAIMMINDRLPEANKRARAKREARKEQEQQRQSAAARERYERQGLARVKAVAIARADYPNHVDSDALGERGWWEDDYPADLVSTYLDPPEVVLKYEIPGGNDDDEIRLYIRERVEAAEANEPEVKNHIRSVFDRREREAAARREEEKQARRDAEDVAAEEEEKRELQRRLAQQKVIRIDDRLK